MLRTALACAVLVLGTGFGAGWLTHGFQVWTAEGARRLEVLQAPIAAPAVPLQGPEEGTGLDLRELLAGRGQVTIVDFIYTHCESLCLSLGSTFQQMQAELRAEGQDAGVRLLSVSFDPQRDSVERLRSYARRMNADPLLWRFVRVPEAAALQGLLDRFQVVVVPDGRGDFQHNAALLVVDAQGRLVRIFDLAERQMALDYARHLAAGGTL